MSLPDAEGRSAPSLTPGAGEIESVAPPHPPTDPTYKSRIIQGEKKRRKEKRERRFLFFPICSINLSLVAPLILL